MAHLNPRRGLLVNFADFVAGRRLAETTPSNEPADQGATPYLPGFEQERPLTARSVEHRRRMLGHLASTRMR